MLGQELIDKARRMGYADSQTAKLLGVSQSYLTDVAAGRKRLSPETGALLADLVGEDGPDVLHRLVVDYEKDPRRKTMLARVLFSGAACCVACGLQLGVTDDAQAADVTSASVYTLCAVAALIGWLLKRHRAGDTAPRPLAAHMGPRAPYP